MEQFYVQMDGFSRQLVHDYEGVMTKVARLGYSGIEIFYGLHGGYSPEGLKEFLGSIGMTVLSSHVEIQDTDQNLEYLPGTGCKYIICPGLAITSMEEALKAAEQLNQLGERARAAGMKYGYHNHSNDFLTVNGKMINDILIENTDPGLVAFEIDVAWAYRAGVDAAQYIRKHSGRFELIHVKETLPQKEKLSFMKPPKKGFRMERDVSGWPKMTPEQAAEMDRFLSINCELGKGIVDMKAIKAAADAQGFTPYYIVERDYAWTGDIFTTLAADAGYLRAL